MTHYYASKHDPNKKAADLLEERPKSFFAETGRETRTPERRMKDYWLINIILPSAVRTAIGVASITVNGADCF